MTRLAALATVALAVLALPALADDHADIEAGKKNFNKCKACHSITAPDGTKIFAGGPVGPNLYGVIGRTAGSLDGYKYSTAMMEAGEKGLVWDQDNIVTYVADPKKFLAEFLDVQKVTTKMTFRTNKGVDDIAAYLVSVGPQN
ncbi:c-type cytochrome [Chachezhania sediminis]|uniref:c-type cytochrome n=1 Tax=Chachezhania sediminis TaxID=2599291 RepID=UPI00131C2EEA|nr:c-type cytochrome [Chachezhania sediminis]